MAAIEETSFVGEVTWIGVVPTDIAEGRIASGAQSELSIGFEGATGEIHSGTTRASCVRVKMLHPEGTEIRNERQISIISQEEMDEIAAEIGLQSMKPEWFGATIVVKGIPDFTHIPPSSRLQADNGLTLCVDMENQPCIWPAKELDRDHPGVGPKFKPAAKGKRGVTASVDRPGSLRVGDGLKLFIPTQRDWKP